jgi:hypothetical protein
MDRSKFHCLQHASATHVRDAGAVMVMASGDTLGVCSEYVYMPCTRYTSIPNIPR